MLENKANNSIYQLILLCLVIWSNKEMGKEKKLLDLQSKIKENENLEM